MTPSRRLQEEEPSLLEAASCALKRLEARKPETIDEWAKRLAPTFFADLDRRAAAMKEKEDE